MNRRLFLKGIAGAVAGIVVVPQIPDAATRVWALDQTMTKIQTATFNDNVVEDCWTPGMDPANRIWFEDDAQYLQRLVNLTPAGGTLVIPPGVYRMDQDIIVDKSITIEGHQRVMLCGVQNPISAVTGDTKGLRYAGRFAFQDGGKYSSLYRLYFSGKDMPDEEARVRLEDMRANRIRWS